MSEITMVEFGQLPALRLRAPDGAEATVTLYGAHLVSWIGKDGRERLFCSAESALDGSRAIRGGVPVIFPQFAARGEGMRHGFARVCNWRAGGGGIEGDTAFALFSLASADLPDEVARAWPHAFALELRVAVRANELSIALEVLNTGEAPLSFAAALHTYYLVDDVDLVRVGGVVDGGLAVGDKLDWIFPGVAGALALTAGAAALHLEQGGFTDAVVWNPGALDAAALNDLGDDEYRRFVCIEPALVDPIALAAGARWRGWQRVLALG
ncbi:aldose epimerase family protein [Massilia glaciei]|uniref:Putative glucose-6-phosphate 1-epimerase n=1 Tax=Massilia glaciei TaxID=1524097 RepID=A0A2U2I7L7_9BURK|nr:D-hexose-6-phosphate mutarotase [Massilia glaciei]PWF55718.1 D-hexose-6-phosphate mutarotase [Massilia glaciei]